jgi:hypothetical protein
MTQRTGPKRSIEEYRRLEKERYWNGEYPNKIWDWNEPISDSSYIDKHGRQEWKKSKAWQNAKIRANTKKAGIKKKGKARSTHKIETDQHFPLFYDVLDNPEFRNGLMKKSWFRTYAWIGRYIVRGEMKSDPHRLYQNYYQKGQLAACVPSRVLAKALKIGKSTAADHIKALSDDGIIKCRTIQGKQSFDGQRYVICIFGNHTDGKERWFIQDRFNLSENPVEVA